MTLSYKTILIFYIYFLRLFSLAFADIELLKEGYHYNHFNTGENMNLQVGVKILLKNDENKYLLLKRNADKYQNMKDLWDIPGGRIELNTSLYENLAREVREETGMQLASSIQILGAQDIFVKDKHVVRITYLGTATGTPILSEEHLDYGWFSLEEIISLEGLDKTFFNLLSENVPKVENFPEELSYRN